jgi:hypothetical protein
VFDMWGYDHMSWMMDGWGMGFGFIFWLLILAAIIGGAVWLLRSQSVAGKDVRKPFKIRARRNAWPMTCTISLGDSMTMDVETSRARRNGDVELILDIRYRSKPCCTGSAESCRAN